MNCTLLDWSLLEAKSNHCLQVASKWVGRVARKLYLYLLEVEVAL